MLQVKNLTHNVVVSVAAIFIKISKISDDNL